MAKTPGYDPDQPAVSDWLADMALLETAARAAGEVALGYFRRSPEVWWKNGGRSPVSAADIAANDILEQQLRAARPDYGWLSEETEDSSLRLASRRIFVIDPIDGTRAFIAGQETWCVSVAVVEGVRPVAAALYAPVSGDMLTATAQGTAFRNGVATRLAAGDEAGLAARRLNVAMSEEMLAQLPASQRGRIHRIPHVPSLALRLAMVADGRIDGTIVRPNSHDWDLAAADLILERAGGALVDENGRALRYNRETVTHGVLYAASPLAMPLLRPGART